MDLELVLPVQDAARILRSKLFTSTRVDRARTAPQRIVWHDCPERTLTARGQVLAERSDGRRLERLLPAEDGAERWSPGAPPPLIAAGPIASDLGLRLPAPLVACAAFEGRATMLRVRWEGAELAATLLRGQLRAVTAEMGCARLAISGPDAPAGSFALAVAAEFAASVPRAALAAEAMSIATGTPLVARALGAPILPRGVSVGTGLRWAVGHLTDVILYWAPEAMAAAGPEPVHQMRVAVRRLRAALSVFGPAAAADAELRCIKDLLRQLNSILGPARDWDVFTVGTGRQVGAAFPDRRPIARLLGAAERRRRACYSELRALLMSPIFRQLGIRLATFVSASREASLSAGEQDPILLQPLATYAATVMDRKLKQTLRGIEDIDGLSDDELHAVRLRGKRLRYAAEFFAPLHPGRETRRYLRRITDLQEHLGELNDGAVAEQLMAQLGGSGTEHAFAVGVVAGFAAARRGLARDELGKVWRKFRQQPGFWR